MEFKEVLACGDCNFILEVRGNLNNSNIRYCKRCKKDTETVRVKINVEC